MLEELKKAESFVFLEYFIIDEGLMWGSILKILADKAAAGGVDVRVMYDGMCEISTLPSDYPKRLEKLGIKCKPFSRIHPFISTHYNYRDHRKILVIDGKTAFNGGVNLADEYINHVERLGHWKDTAIMLKGDAVQSFTLMFLQMWNMVEAKAAYSLTKSHYRSLVNAGVKVYEYDPGFVHAKIFVSDDEKAVVGTINLDYRSLHHHFECATYLYKVSCIPEIEADYLSTLKKCHEVTNETIKNEKLYYKALGSLMKLIAPLM